MYRMKSVLMTDEVACGVYEVAAPSRRLTALMIPGTLAGKKVSEQIHITPPVTTGINFPHDLFINSSPLKSTPIESLFSPVSIFGGSRTGLPKTNCSPSH